MNSVHGGGACSKFGGCLLQIFGGYFFGGGVFFQGGIFWGGFFGGGSPLEYGHRSAGTHPTGMHSCINLKMQRNGSDNDRELLFLYIIIIKQMQTKASNFCFN